MEDLSPAAVVPLPGGQALLNSLGGPLRLLDADGSVRDLPSPRAEEGWHPRRRLSQLADGRLVVSTDGHGTRIWSAAGEPGPQIHDDALSAARLLADGSLLLWQEDRGNSLQIIDTDGKPGPLLRGHDGRIKDAIQLADGRILSWAEDASIRVWPGSLEQAVALADDVIRRLQPLTEAERCAHYLETPEACAELGKDQ